ncbi:MAG: deoxyribodipyrimidine photo-lyase [Anaerolineae bacterium]|nr:deoxyribodipyrimidine photo-lyase [Anaerolineae bacterium]
MQSAQRAVYNHALEFALERANAHHVPLVVYFGLADRYPGPGDDGRHTGIANTRHFRFLLEGLGEVQAALRDRGLPMIVQRVSPEAGALNLGRAAAAVVVDRGYLRTERAWYQHVAERLDCPLWQVETNVVVPIAAASERQEYAARTLRPKIGRQWETYLAPLAPREAALPPLELDVPSLDLTDAERLLDELSLQRVDAPLVRFRGGTSQAETLLRAFVQDELARYADARNDPTEDCTSHMSPYLHFGQISPLWIALQVLDGRSPNALQDEGSAAYLEELIVRRELASNYVHHNQRYDRLAGLPDWAQATLAEHASDPRDHVYSRGQWERAQTHDPYWNAAQLEMVLTGKMHGYMRMYWGKKILEWSADPETAFATALYLNDKYELDGRDPNGYTGVAWCFGLHDRPWRRRPVYGSVRYMNANGLKRKFDADAYVARVRALQAEATSSRGPGGERRAI